MNPRKTQNWSLAEAAHLLNRAAFGGPPNQVRALHALGPVAAVERLLAGEKADPDPMPAPAWASAEAYRAQVREFLEMRREAGVVDKPARAVQAAKGKSGPGEAVKAPTGEMEKDEPAMAPGMAEDGAAARKNAQAKMKLQKYLRELSRDQGIELTHWWFRRMVSGPHPAAEKMALFWHGHFATSMEKVRVAYYMFRQNDLFRKHALGNFGALTRAIVRDPAMMVYLDLQQSKKQKPNENFARELMELFTLGEGHYTEDDIKESARAFTGLRLGRLTGEVTFSKYQHDNGVKKFHGRSGEFGPDEVVDILIEQPACATFLARKLWRYFVNDAPGDADVAALAATLRAQKFEIGATLRTLFLSEAFYRRENIRAGIKSPVDFLVQMTRQLELKDLPRPVLLGGMREMGQQLFLPPNVAGWPGGSAWINTNTLFARYNMAGVIARGADPDYSITGIKGIGGQGGKNKEGGKARAAGAGEARRRFRRDLPQPDYAAIAPPESRANPDSLIDDLVFRFFQSPLRKEDRDGFLSFARKESEAGLTDVEIGHLIHLMLSTPYYQLT